MVLLTCVDLLGARYGLEERPLLVSLPLGLLLLLLLLGALLLDLTGPAVTRSDLSQLELN